MDHITYAYKTYHKPDLAGRIRTLKLPEDQHLLIEYCNPFRYYIIGKGETVEIHATANLADSWLF
jgi:hypothetical protein